MKTYNERTQSINDKVIEQKAKRARNITTISAVSAALALVLTFNLVLFAPYQAGGFDLTPYRDSEYYNIIERLSGLTQSQRYTTNNFTEWFGGRQWLPDAPSAPGEDFATSDGNGSNSNGHYNETTLNQTGGVTEGDLFKRTDKYIFYLDYTIGGYDVIINESENGYTKVEERKASAYVLNAYTIAGEQSTLAVSYTVNAEENTSFRGYWDEREMFLSEDGNFITVISPCYNNEVNALYTAIIRLDISDLDNITEVNRIYVSGNYVSARDADGTLLLVSNFTVRRNVNFDNKAQFLPQYGTIDNLTTLPVDDIICPETITRANYTVIYAVDYGTLESIDCIALLSYSDDVYVSQNNLFVTRNFIQDVDTQNEYRLTYSYDKSEIIAVPYSDEGFGATQSVTADGRALNRFCLDEYEGVLRVTTTMRYYNASYVYTDPDDPYPELRVNPTVCNLYCYDLASMQAIAAVEHFAPLGESVKSARFDGDTAYVCTADIPNDYFDYSAPIFDPVYAFDLSDYNNITYKDTGTIPGYSLSLLNFKDDTLLGIGYGDSLTTLKIEVYEVAESDVQSVAKIEYGGVAFSDEVKAHFVDKDNGLIGLAVYNRSVNSNKASYKLWRFDGYDIKEISDTPIDSVVTEYARAAYIDGYLYIFANNTFKVVEVQ